MSVLMLTIFVVMVGVASQYPPQARFMPMVIGIPGIALCAYQLFVEVRASRKPREAAAAGGLDPATVSGEARREIVLWAYFIGLVAALILFGFWPTIPAFVTLFLRYAAAETWRFSLGLGLGGTILLFLVFDQGLGVVLHGGFITGYVLDRFIGQ